MKKYLKVFSSLLTLLLVASLAVFPVTVIADQNSQNKTMDFMEQVLPIDLSKYTINLLSDATLDIPFSKDNRKINTILYELSSKNSKMDVSFIIENGIIWDCSISPLEGKVITNKQYSTLFDAVKSFMEIYQSYTKIDSNKLTTMLDNVDITKNSTLTTENTKLTITHATWVGRNLVDFKWRHILNDVEYNALSLTFDKDERLLLSVSDDRALYTIRDTSINISQEQAIDIALKGLKSYSYDMPDGSIVTDFKVSKDNVVATLATVPINYEFRTYWDVRMLLYEVYPGSVFGISAFIWADTGEIIEYSNMASGGINYPDSNTNSTDTPTAPIQNSNRLTIAMTSIAVIAVIAVALTGVFMIKKKQK